MKRGSTRSVVIVSRIYEPETGAAAFRLAAIVRAFRDAGYETTVITTQPPGRIASTSAVRRWPVLRDRSGAVRGYLQYASFDIPAFFRLLFVRRPSFVIAEPPPTTGVVTRLVCRLRGIPFAYFAADVSSSAARGIGVNRHVVQVLEKVERWVLTGAHVVLAVSAGVRDEVVSLGVAPDRVAVVGTGIDTEVFSQTGQLADDAWADEPYFVYAGTMSEIQGAGIFIDGFAEIIEEHPTARLLMLGDGVEVNRLYERARQLAPGNIHFLGRVSGDEVASWLRGARAGLASVRPERGYDFAYATKALVSISCGTPVIYAGVGPARQLISDNRLGWTVEWDAWQVAEAMAAALAATRHPAERDRLSSWAQENASLHAVGDRVVHSVDSVVAALE